MLIAPCGMQHLDLDRYMLRQLLVLGMVLVLVVARG
jgi:hypothetical protein